MKESLYITVVLIHGLDPIAIVPLTSASVPNSLIPRAYF